MQAYLITNKSNNKGYVGITTRSLDRRWYEHRFVANSCGKLLAKAINKYGEQAFEIMPIASAKTLENLKEVEKDLIVQFGTKVPNGYNLTDGGDGVFGFKHSAETVKKVANLRLGTKHTKETIEKMRLAHLGEKNHFYGRKHTEEAKQKLSISRKGKKYPKLSEALKGRVISEEWRKKVSDGCKLGNAAKAKIVLDTQTGVYYSCAKEASDLYGINQYTFKAYLKGVFKTKQTRFIYA